MYPLDLEEFLWANGISEEVIERLRISFTILPADFFRISIEIKKATSIN